MKRKSFILCSARYATKFVTALCLSACIFTYANAKDLNSFFNENETIYIGVQPIEGALPEVDWIFVKNEDQQWTLVDNQQYYGADSGPARSDTVSLNVTENTLTAYPDSDILGYTLFQPFDVYSEEFENNWGSLVASQLQKATEQGLMPSGDFFEVISRFEQIEITPEDNELFNSDITYQEVLLIPESLYTNIDGGWQGPTEIEKGTVTNQTSSKNIVESY